MDADTVYENLRAISHDFTAERRERQRRRELVAADFARLRDAGFLLTGVPVDHGGIWESVGASARPICEMLRTLAHGDSSVALGCAMHPAVLNFWMATSQAPAPFDKAWDEQRRSIFRNVCAGAWWGTIASDPALRATSRGQGPRRGEARPMAPTCSPDRKTLAAGRGLPPT